MNPHDYWKECLASSFDEHGIPATIEQIDAIAQDVEIARDQFGMTFYSPPASDRIEETRREATAKLDALQREFDAYRTNAETAVKKALNQRSDAHVAIEEHGQVFRFDGRCEQIQ